MRLYLISLLLLLALVLQGCSTVPVHVTTIPSGGQVKVVETAEVVPDGGEVWLGQGNYTFIPHGVANSPVKVMVKVGTSPVAVMVPVSPGMTRFSLATVPAGAQVTIVEQNRVVNDGETFELPAGSFTLQATLAGYKPRPVVVETSGRGEENLMIHLGDGYGRLKVAVSPASAALYLNGNRWEPAAAGNEMKAGSYTLDAKTDGYYSKSQQVSLSVASEFTAEITLRKIPTTAAVDLSTRPSGGVISYQGRKLGTSRAHLSAAPVGQSQAVAIKRLDALTRLYGTGNFSVTLKNKPVVINMNQRQRLYAGKWLAEASALKQEQQRFNSQRVANPVSVKVQMTAQQVEAFPAGLFAAMRVGDALLLEVGSHSYPLIKRHAAETDDWRAALAAAVKGGSPQALPYPAATQIVAGVSGAPTAANILYALHRARNPIAHLDLAAAQLNAQGEELVHRSGDGELTLLAIGGDVIAIDGVKAVRHQGYWLASLPAAQQTVKLSWASKPQQLLVVGDRALALRNPKMDKELLIGEKQLVRLAQEEVLRLETLTRIDGVWSRKVSVASGPLAAQMNLAVDEVGPHGQAGDFKRVWLLQFGQKGNLTQRQLACDYQVTRERKDNEDNRFLRRDKLSGQ
jgi:hypothetical protein